MQTRQSKRISKRIKRKCSSGFQLKRKVACRKPPHKPPKK